jgi:hypothetical protein
LVHYAGGNVDGRPTLFDVADLPPGWIARRASMGAPWHRELDSDV